MIISIDLDCSTPRESRTTNRVFLVIPFYTRCWYAMTSSILRIVLLGRSQQHGETDPKPATGDRSYVRVIVPSLEQTMSKSSRGISRLLNTQPRFNHVRSPRKLEALLHKNDRLQLARDTGGLRRKAVSVYVRSIFVEIYYTDKVAYNKEKQL